MVRAELTRLLQAEDFIDGARQVQFSDVTVDAVSQVGNIVVVPAAIDERRWGDSGCGSHDVRPRRPIAVVQEKKLGRESGSEKILHVEVCQDDVVVRKTGAELVLARGVLREGTEHADVILINVVVARAKDPDAD